MRRRLKAFVLLNRRGISVALHLVLASIAFVLAFLIRFEFRGIPPQYCELMLKALPVSTGIKGITIVYFGLTAGLWRYVGINDLSRILKAVTVSSLAFIVASLVFFGHGFPRSIYILDFLLTIMLFGGMRFAIRLFRESFRPMLRQTSGKRTLIIGAGDAGEIALRSLMKDYMGVYNVVGFLDDDPGKKNMSIHGYPILGTVPNAARLVKELAITEVLIAISAASKSFIKATVESCSAHNVNFRIMPAIKDLMTGEMEIEAIRKVKLEDLLGRDPIQLDRDAVSGQIKGERVLITGAGGSIGSEIARQVAAYSPSKLVLLDFAESALFEIDRHVREEHPEIHVVPCLTDIRQADAVMSVFETHAPQKVFHAAAYKHVPLMEQHPTDAVCTNVVGTRNVVDAAVKHGVGKFVMISTDKAVRPTSVMGATKRLCELVVSRQESNGTQFASVRFGNVLGSNGSVIPIFEKQIARGGPVRVTDPDMTRYFMTIPEAVELVLQASALAQANDVFVLDMGTPVKIMDLARNMIELSGMVVDEDIKIEIMGARPGEKTHEELVTYGEDLMETDVDKISLLRKNNHRPGGDHFDRHLEKLEKLALKRKNEETVRCLWEIIEADQESAGRGKS
jgi:FlaA1/EpsC-like NDP-sugar epimerase